MIVVRCILLKKAQNTVIYVQDNPPMIKFYFNSLLVYLSCRGAVVLFVCLFEVVNSMKKKEGGLEVSHGEGLI